MSNYFNHYDLNLFYVLFGELFGVLGIEWNKYLFRFDPRRRTLEIESPGGKVRMEIKGRLSGDWWISIYEIKGNKLWVSLSWTGRIGNLQWLIEDGILELDFEKEFLDAIKSSKTIKEKRDLLGLHHGGSTGEHRLDDREFTNQLKFRGAKSGPQMQAQFEETDQ